ncbi:Maf family protein [Desulfobotulus sp. H1]|uniref:dTTP/UTP pyrophosphatase n=1 Tax=Desulfobotulus pelophilus TaxID=2823377 RepID=A0ABT3N8D1_9BACT|nr:Maf family protein [Desulfobotulus pelophilus]MCW7753714.1 Maf family protein [Desulfobotulus pelophilus]
MHQSNSPQGLILASASPRRQELLSQAGLQFQIITSDIDEESILADTPRILAAAIAQAKAREVATLHPENWILAADTLVVAGDQVLGKPANPEEAVSMLKRLSGISHQVITGVALCCTAQKKLRSYAVTTDVSFKELTAQEIAWYTATPEPYDKAGAYAIQGLAAHFIRHICGSYTNVVGLPICEVMESLSLAGIVPSYVQNQNGVHAL